MNFFNGLFPPFTDLCCVFHCCRVCVYVLNSLAFAYFLYCEMIRQKLDAVSKCRLSLG